MSTMQVPLLDLKPQYASLKSEALAAIERVCASQGFILGPEVTRLEKDVAAYSQCQLRDRRLLGYRCTAAGADGAGYRCRARGHYQPLHLFRHRRHHRAHRCTADVLRHRPGELQPRSAGGRDLPEPGCEVRGGALVNRATGGIVKALMPVHLYGQVADMEPLLALARRSA